MNIGQAFPSNYLKADDLNGKAVTLTIEEVGIEGIGKDKDQKLVIAFVGKQKKFVCNKTNAKTISKLHGEETDEWVGKRITIRPAEVEFQGEMVLSIRVSLQAPVEGSVKTPAPQPPPTEDADQEVPF